MPKPVNYMSQIHQQMFRTEQTALTYNYNTVIIMQPQRFVDSGGRNRPLLNLKTTCNCLFEIRYQTKVYAPKNLPVG